MSDLLQFVDHRATAAEGGYFVSVEQTAIFCDDTRVLDFAKTWDKIYQLLELHDFTGSARALFSLASELFKWRTTDAEDIKYDFPIAFQEHVVWLCGNLCMCISHFKMIEKIENSDNRGGLFRGLQTLASKTSPYGGCENKTLEQTLNVVQQRCLEEAQVASIHSHFNARRIKEAVTILSEIPETKKTKILRQTIKSYCRGSIPESGVYTNALLVKQIEVPSLLDI